MYSYRFDSFSDMKDFEVSHCNMAIGNKLIILNFNVSKIVELRRPAEKNAISSELIIVQFSPAFPLFPLAMVHAFSCAYIELWVRLKRLKTTQEAAPRATLTVLPPFTHAKA